MIADGIQISHFVTYGSSAILKCYFPVLAQRYRVVTAIPAALAMPDIAVISHSRIQR
jgi:hypothetical protein